MKKFVTLAFLAIASVVFSQTPIVNPAHQDVPTASATPFGVPMYETDPSGSAAATISHILGLITVGTGAPGGGTPVQPPFYWDDTGNDLYAHDGTSWATVGGGGGGLVNWSESGDTLQPNGDNTQDFGGTGNRVAQAYIQEVLSYNLFTDASNYELAQLVWDTNVFEFRTTALGTGTARSIRVDPASVLNVAIAGTDRYEFDSTAIFPSTAGLDLGRSSDYWDTSYITTMIASTLTSVAAGDITIDPDTTGNIILGNFNLDADATVGAGQDNYVLTYDHSTQLWGPEAGGVGGGDAWSDPVDAVITPDADGTRDLATTVTRFATGYFDDLDVTTDVTAGGTFTSNAVETDTIDYAEQADGGAPAAGFGRFWVRTDNTPMFTDEADVDSELNSGLTNWSESGTTLQPNADSTQDFGASGNKINDIHMDGSITFPSTLALTGGAYIWNLSSTGWTTTNANRGVPQGSTGARWGTLFNGRSLTGAESAASIDVDSVWNTTGTPSLLKLNVLDTASNAASLLIEAEVGGVDQFSVSKAGDLVLTGTVDGRDVDADGTKLDGIEALADVTDTANVQAAGALMDSEVDADIQTFALPANTTISAFGATLVDDADAPTARTTLGIINQTNEEIEDIAGPLVATGGTKTGISVTYQDATGDMDFVTDVTLTGAETLTTKTIDGDNNTLSNLDLGNEVDWAVISDVTDRTAFQSGDKILIYEAGVGMRKADFDDLPGAGGGANTNLGNLTATAINLSLISDTDITDDLGSAAIRWNDIYAATAGTGDTATDTFKIRGRDIDGASWVDVLTVTANNDVTADLWASTTIGGADIVTPSTTDTFTNKTIDADNNTVSGIDLGLEAEWATITDLTDRTAFEAGDKLMIFEAGVGMRRIDYSDLPAGDLWSDPVDAVITPDADGTRDFGLTGTRFATGYFDNLIVTSNVVSDTGFVRVSAASGLTASVTQTQGQGALTREWNEIATVANTNDTVTLATAASGKVQVVINNGANTLQIFPASGDNLGQGVDTATTLAAGEGVTYRAYDSTNYEEEKWTSGAGDAWSDPVDAVITPDADGTRDFGLTGTRFATGYFDQLEVTNGFNLGGTVTTTSGFLRGSATTGITASTTQTQGQGALNREIAEVSVVANPNDTITLIAAAAGRRHFIVNNGANTLQIFPASGDDLGQGVDTATTLAVGEGVTFRCIDATTWLDERWSPQTEEVQDIAGPLVATGGTKTGITVTYQDGTNDMDFVTDVTLTGAETLTTKTIDADNNTISNIDTGEIKAATLVTESETIASNDNDTTLPTSAAVKDYSDNATATQTNKTLDSGSNTIRIHDEEHTGAGPHTLTASDCYNGVHYVTAASTVNLPAVADGMSLTIISEIAGTVVVNPNGTEVIKLDGTSAAAGENIESPGAVGDIVTLTYRAASTWYAASNSWTEETP